jgi:branched-chain amino acid transport system permease protein
MDRLRRAVLGHACRSPAFVCFGVGYPDGVPGAAAGWPLLALATFALALAVPQLLKYKGSKEWTGGVQGIVLMKPQPPFEFSMFGETS